jgi:HlyD family secretion protein
MTSKKVWVTLLVLAAAACAGALRCRARSDKPTVRFSTAIAERGTIVARVSATGTLSALVTVQVGSQVSGRIREILVDWNSKVQKDQVLARIDQQLFQATLAQARANQFAARGALSKARATAANMARRLNRSRTLAQDNFVAEAELDQAQADASAAQAEVDAARGTVAQAAAATRQAEVNLTYATILSPIDGVVISRNVDVGQTVAASLQAPTLFTIAGDLGKMQVDTSVAEADVGKLASGMPATFTVDAYPSSVFRGPIREVRNAPQTMQNVVTYDVVLNVDNRDLKLKPGMTAHVMFVYADRKGVLKVPNAAFRFRASPESSSRGGEAPDRRRRARSETDEQERTTDHRALWVLRRERPERVPVRVGLSDGRSTEIVEGTIDEGDRVVVDEDDDATSRDQRTNAPARARLF